MTRGKVLIVGGTVCFLVGVGILAGTTLDAAGAFKDLEPHGTAQCEVLEGFSGGTEDFIARADDTLFVSSPDFRDPDAKGRIYLVDPATRAVRDVTPDLPFSFQPHGVGLWHDGLDERLFVVNHRDGSALPDAAGADTGKTVHSVEVFDVAPDGSLTHVSSVRGDRLVSPNDVAPVGPESFYVTNDHGYAGGLMRTLEDWLRIPAGDVVFVDRGRTRTVWEGTRYANGIAVSPDGRSVYVAETTGLQVRKFDRDLDSGDLTFDIAIELDTGVDNLNFDADGNLWTGAHPKLLAFTEHAEDPQAKSPSQILRLEHAGGDDWIVDEVWLDDGDLLSGSSVAWTDGERVIAGAVFQSKLVICPYAKDRGADE